MREGLGKFGVDPDVPEGDVVALDENAKQDRDFVHSVAVSDLLVRWRGHPLPGQETLPSAYRGFVGRWQQSLNERRVANYCGAISGLIRETLYDATSGKPAIGYIEDLRGTPRLQVFASPKSQLAEIFRLVDGGDVYVGPAEFGTQVAARCGDPFPPDDQLVAGALAWRYLASSVVEVPDALPRIVTTPKDGKIEVRERPIE
jgi:hypothetical protein